MRATTWRHCAVVNAVADIVAAAAATVVVVVVVVDVFVLFVVLVGIVTPSSLLTHPSLPYPVFRVRIQGYRSPIHVNLLTSVFHPLNRHSAPPYIVLAIVGKDQRRRRGVGFSRPIPSLPSTGSRPLVGKLG